MHSHAYIDGDSDTIRYQPLRSGGSLAVYGEVEPRIHHGMTPDALRASGKTRRAAVHGRIVAFMRLSPTCRVTPVWDTFWHEEYASEIEADAAALHWEEKRMQVLKPGFMEAQA